MYGKARQARSGEAWCGEARYGMAGEVGFGSVRSGRERYGMAGVETSKT